MIRIRIIFAAVLALALMAIPVAAQAPQLAVNDVCTTHTERVVVTFAFKDAPKADYAKLAVEVFLAFDGGAPFTTVAPFVAEEGRTVHFAADLPGTPRDVDIILAELRVDNMTYRAVNPGVFVTYPCANPTAVELASLTAGTTARCKLTGNGKSKVCNIGRRWRDAPMGLCR